MIGFIWALVGAVFGAGVILTTIRGDIATLRKDLNGIGSKLRQDEGKAERRWKHMIATQIETSTDLEEARKHATLLREDAWRD